VSFDALVFDSDPGRISVPAVQWCIDNWESDVATTVRPPRRLVNRCLETSESQRRRFTPIEMIEVIEACLRNQSCIALEWVSGQVMIVARAGEHGELLDALAALYRDVIISDYRAAIAPCGSFRLANFGDYEAEAEVCWQLARGEADSVLVLCEFGSFGEWWRPATAQATSLCVSTGVDYQGQTSCASVVYRVSSAQVLSELWSRTSYDDGIARLCAPATADAEQILALADSLLWSDRALIQFAQRQGWVYIQRFGGGADEHYAKFAAADPALTARVYEHAQERAKNDSGWWLFGVA